MWKVNHDKGDLNSMQSFACSKLPNQDDYGTVTDSRDGTTYKVAKLKDGKCWMVENLKIQGKVLTSNDSDVSSNFTLPASSTSNGTDYNTAYVRVEPDYGGYYSWYAATAGTGTKNMNYDQEASSSICPKGWHLPTGVSGGEFETLAKAYGYVSENNESVRAASEALRATPIPGFTLAGEYYNFNNSPSLGGRDSHGCYWSSTAYGSKSNYSENYYADDLEIQTSRVDPTYQNIQYAQLSVRCVADSN